MQYKAFRIIDNHWLILIKPCNSAFVCSAAGFKILTILLTK